VDAAASGAQACSQGGLTRHKATGETNLEGDGVVSILIKEPMSGAWLERICSSRSMSARIFALAVTSHAISQIDGGTPESASRVLRTRFGGA
jgi:hypothetical protein